MMPWFAKKSFSYFRDGFAGLLVYIKKYLTFLENQRTRTAEHHAMTEPVRSLRDTWKVELYEGSPANMLKVPYQNLQDSLSSMQLHEPISLLDLEPVKKYDRLIWLRNLKLQFPVSVYTYEQGNYLGNLKFAWKVPANKDDRTDEGTISVVSKIRELIQCAKNLHICLQKQQMPHQPSREISTVFSQMMQQLPNAVGLMLQRLMSML